MAGHQRWRRWLRPLVLGVGLALGVGWLAYRASQNHGIAILRADSDHRLDLLAASLEREMSKYAYFPAILNLEEDVRGLLKEPQEGRWLARVNPYLENLNQYAGTLAIYVVNPEGTVMASSNWRRPDSFIGEHLAFRPYFTDALQQGTGRFFGIGTTRGEPGYYLAHRLTDNGQIIGLAVIKVGFEHLQDAWSASETPALVADDNGVVILATTPAWRFTTLQPLDAATRQKIEQTLQYNRRELKPLPMQARQPLDDGAFVARFAPKPNGDDNTAAAMAPPNGLFLARTRAMPAAAWQLTVFLPLAATQRLALNHAVLAGLTSVLALSLTWVAHERRRSLRARLAAREALQRAHDQLERKVAERTMELSAANARLRQEIAERARIEQRLRSTREEVVQAAKLAVIGQLSAEIVHELNQPLAALRTLAGNTVIFLRNGNLETAYTNLVRTDHLIERMAKITDQLKLFARKSPVSRQRIAVNQVINDALALLEQRLRKYQIAIQIRPSASEAFVWGDCPRLEQVFVNLVNNAVDANRDAAQPMIDISWEIEGCFVAVRVRDHGAGLSEAVEAQLFKPFFTTKIPGQGLGLGLAISADILAEFGGALTGANHPQRGAVFTVELPLAARGDSHAC